MNFNQINLSEWKRPSVSLEIKELLKQGKDLTSIMLKDYDALSHVQQKENII